MGKRNLSIDLVRLFAAYGVIALHVPYNGSGIDVLHVFFWPICVPFFYVVSLTYFVNGLKKKGSDQYLKNWSRLIVPYLSWTVIYLSLLLVNHLLMGKGEPVIWWRAILYGESAVHLYFIPTLLFMQAIAMGIYLLIKGCNRVVAWVALTVSCAYFIVGVFYNCYGIRSIGSLFGTGLFIATAFWIDSQFAGQISFKKRYTLSIIGLFLLTLSLVCNFSSNLFIVAGYSLIYPLGGVGLFLISIVNPIYKVPLRLVTLASYSYGIYLCHIVFLETYEIIQEKIFYGYGKNGFTGKLFEVSVIFVISICFVVLVRRISVLRQLLLGEK